MPSRSDLWTALALMKSCKWDHSGPSSEVKSGHHTNLSALNYIFSRLVCALETRMSYQVLSGIKTLTSIMDMTLS